MREKCTFQYRLVLQVEPFQVHWKRSVDIGAELSAVQKYSVEKTRTACDGVASRNTKNKREKKQEDKTI